MHQVEVESSSREAFDLSMKLAFLQHSEATHLLVDKKEGCLVFFWHAPEKHWHATKLRKPMNAEDAANYTWEWLTREYKGNEKPKLPEPVVGSFHLKAGGEFRLYWKAKHSYSPDDGSSYGIVAVWLTYNEVIQ